jgi:hypothetical protein
MDASNKYLIFANQADMYALTANDPVLRAHFIHMAAQWRRRAQNMNAVDDDLCNGLTMG